MCIYLYKWLPRRWYFVLGGNGLKGRGVSFKTIPKIVAYKDKEKLQRLLSQAWFQEKDTLALCESKNQPL